MRFSINPALDRPGRLGYPPPVGAHDHSDPASAPPANRQYWPPSQVASFMANRHGLILPAILLIALAFRLATVRFGLPALNDPDELMFEVGALHMLRGATLNPGWFGHPATITMYALALIDAGVFGIAWASGRAPTPKAFGDLVYSDPSWIILPGRIAAVLVSVAVIWVAARLTQRMFGRNAGLACAVLLALDPVHVTWSQIIRADMTACLFMLLCLDAALDVSMRGRRYDYARGALWLGLALASKWPFGLAALGLAGASVVVVRAGVVAWSRALGRLAATGAGAVGVLLLSSPFLLIDWPVVVHNLRGEGQVRHLGATGGGFLFNMGWYLGGPVATGFGLAGIALLALGLVALAREQRPLAVLAPVGIGFLVVLSAQSLIWERWSLPLLVLGAVIAGLGFARLSALLHDRLPVRAAKIALAGVLFVTLVPLALRDWGDGRARMNDTRQLASVWARGHIPRGSSVLVEHYAFDLVDEPWQLLFPIGDAGCLDALALMHGRINPAAIDQARNGRSNVDYGTMAPSRRAACRPDFAILAQADRYRQERDRFPREYAAYVTLARRGTIATTFVPVPGRVGGPVVTVIDLRRGKGTSRHVDTSKAT